MNFSKTAASAALIASMAATAAFAGSHATTTLRIQRTMRLKPFRGN